MRFNQQTDSSSHTFKRSILGLFAMFICALFAAGCSSGGSGDGFVANPTGGPAGGGGTGGAVGNGSVTFNFVKAQSNPIVVPASTVQLRFEFFTGLQGTGTIVKSETRDFAQSITIENVPASVQSSVVTAITPEGFPVAEFTANITVPVSGNTTVDATQGTTVPVDVSSLTSSPMSAQLGNGDSLPLQFTAVFSNGDSVPLQATSVNLVTSDATVVSVAPDGTITAGLNGNAMVTATFNVPGFAAASVDVPVIVGSGIQAPPLVTNLVIETVEAQPVTLPRGTVSQPITVRATFDDGSVRVVTQQNGVEFSSNNPEVSVNASNQIEVSNQATAPGNATITAKFMNVTSSVNVVVSAAQLTSISVSPAAISLPFGGFETTITATATTSAGDPVQLLPGNLSFSPMSTDRYSVNAMGLLTSAPTIPGIGAGTDTLTVTAMHPDFPGQSVEADIPVTVGEIFVESLTVTPLSVPDLVPGDVQVFQVIANLSGGNGTVDVSDFAALLLTPTQSGNPPNNIEVNNKQVVAVAPTAPNDPATVTFTMAGSGSNGDPVSTDVFVTVLSEVLDPDTITYQFAGLPIQFDEDTLTNAVNLPRGYVGVVEVFGTFNSGITRRLRPEEYTLILENENNGQNGAAIKLWGTFPGVPGAPVGDYYVHTETRARFHDNLKEVVPIPDTVDDLYYRPRTISDLGNLQGSTQSTTVDSTVSPNGQGIATTRPTFRALVADWRRGARERGSLGGGDLISADATPFLSPGSVRRVTVRLDQSVLEGPVEDEDFTFTVTVIDPVEVEVASIGFVNYPNDSRTPIGVLREYEVKLNFKAVTLEDQAPSPTADLPSIGPRVNEIVGFKVAEANLNLSSATGGANQFLFTTPTSLGFVGVSSNQAVQANNVSARAVPVGGDNIRPVLVDPAENTYEYVTRVYGVESSGFEGVELKAQVPPRDLPLDAEAEPDDLQIRVLEEFVGQSINFLDPFLFSIDPINPDGVGTAVDLVLGSSQVFRTMVQYLDTQQFVDVSADYTPVLFTDSATPAAIGRADENPAIPGRLVVSATNSAGGTVQQADIDDQTGDTILGAAIAADFPAAFGAQAIVVALDAAGLPIRFKGQFTQAAPDLRSNAGNAHAISTLDVVDP